ncbi:MAG: ribose 5-phosphate isomerase B [Clostridia bacterium]|nr:ribose 5-phosphate isomerase B [Clostridia bacterium]
MAEISKICAIASDGAGFKLKCLLFDYLKEIGYDVIDCGTDSDASCDYPDFAVKCCREITEKRAGFGILCCGTGVGMSMAANKVNGIRAACCSDTFSAKATRAHNDANILCIGERVVGPGLAKELVNAFINTSFEGGRHQRRVDKVMEIENS